MLELPSTLYLNNESSRSQNFRLIVKTKRFLLFFKITGIKDSGRFSLAFLVFWNIRRILVFTKCAMKIPTTIIPKSFLYCLPFSHKMYSNLRERFLFFFVVARLFCYSG